MARRTMTVTIAEDNRDKGRAYLLQEMAATQAEKWAARAFLAMTHSGVEFPDDVSKMGMAGLAAVGIKAMAGMTFTDAEPLLDEMFGCIRFIPDPSRPETTRPLIEDDIDEVSTRLKLRVELFKLHTDFLGIASP